MTDTAFNPDAVFVVLDTVGKAAAFYRSDVHGADIPPAAIEITETQWRAWLADPAQILAGGILQPAPFTAADLATLKGALCDDIDRQAQAIRDRYVTPGGAQAATYLYKQTQAGQAQANQTADVGKTAAQLALAYPYLANEIGITLDPSTGAPATDVYGVVRAVIATLQVWQPLNLAIEAMRLKTKGAINAAATAEAAQAAHDAVQWPPA